MMDKAFLQTPGILPLEEKLGKDKLTPAPSSHLVVRDTAVCVGCPGRECIPACPAGTYEWDAESRRLHVSFENCLECGTCRVSCPFDNIEWTNPSGGFGVSYRYG
jgi:ferredoxin like protein